MAHIKAHSRVDWGHSRETRPGLRGIIVLTLLLTGGSVTAQNLVLNGSFEQGVSAPANWDLTGQGRWENHGRSGNRSVQLQGTECNNEWNSLYCSVQSKGLYSVSFWAKGGTPYSEKSGTIRVGWDQFSRILRPQDYWRQHKFAALLPTTLSSPRLRLRQCQVGGGLLVDDVEVRPALPLHLLTQEVTLGAGESMAPGKKISETRLGEDVAGYSRELKEQTAEFDSWLWTLKPGTSVTYLHSQDGRAMTGGSVKLTPYWADKGALIVEGSLNGTNWVEAGRLEPAVYGYFSTPLQVSLPTNLFPVTNLHVRLRSTTGTFMVSAYRFEASVPANQASAKGKTWFLGLDATPRDVRFLGMIESTTGWVCRVELQNPTTATRQFVMAMSSEGPAGTRTNETRATVPGSGKAVVDVLLPPAGAGENVCNLEFKDSANGSVLLKGSLPMTVAALQDQDFGYGLPGPKGCDVWWCESGHKVSRSKQRVLGTAGYAEISAARNEYEPLQLVLRPGAAGLTNARVTVSDLGLINGDAKISATNVEVCLVEYVKVWQASDDSGTIGEHPDPITILTNSFSVPANTNQPLWLTVYVPKDVPAGIYQGVVSIISDNVDPINVSVRVRVYNFELPDTTHTTTAYRTWLDEDWHKFSTPEQRRAVWDLYMQNYRKHRMMPTHPHAYAPILWTLVGDQFTLDTRDFDVAMSRYLDEFGFTGFNVFDPPLTLGDFERHTPEYRALLPRLVERIGEHLRTKGWEKKGYIWWYDEPNYTRFQNLNAEMNAIQQGAPELKRVVTYQPDPGIHGAVDVWVPLLMYFPWHYDRVIARKALNEEFWWYVCVWPPYPYPNNYIDHPAINHRIRAWMAERFDVRGDLYWSSTWYKTTNALTRNPWTDPMCGLRESFLANGDGLLLYPPVRALPTSPVLSGPVNSLRWELMRESMEDGEYFWLLRQTLERGLERLGLNDPAVREGYAARDQAMALVQAVDDYSKKPQDLVSARRRVGEAIEWLSDGSPFIVRQPVGRAAKAGESISFRAEALGWPTPNYQWLFNGTPLSGATQSVLSLASVSTGQSGRYKVVASNKNGTTTSEEANLVVIGTGNQAPRFVSEPPATLLRRVGEKALLSASVAGSAPMVYSWQQNGNPLPSATNTTLLFTNLTPGNFGSYRLIVRNTSGSVTSSIAQIIDVDKVPLMIAREQHSGLPQLSFPVRGRSTTILASTNFQRWDPLGTFATPSPTIKLLDTEGLPKRFFKLQSAQ